MFALTCESCPHNLVVRCCAAPPKHFALRNVSMLITIYDHDHYDSCSTSNRDSVLVALRPCAAKFLARQLHVVERNKFLSESCVRKQPKHPLDRSACRSSHTQKNFFSRPALLDIIPDGHIVKMWPSSAIVTAIRAIDRSF